ncbi:DUF308 domain-containing protein [Blautia schinkii]|nr:DUF308 domain-containing protein [Blautia schinkii]
MGKRFSKILKGQITSSVFYVLFGLCLILMPVKTVDVICKVVFGLVLIGAGCYHVYIYVKEKESSTILDLFSGVIVLVLGGFLFYNPQVVVKLLPLLLGAFVLVDSIWTLQGCLKLKKYGREEWKALLLGSLIFIVLGIAMVINPFPGVKYTVIFAGWVFLLNGAADLAFLWLLRKSTDGTGEADGDTAPLAEAGAVSGDDSKDNKKSEPDSEDAPEEWHDAWTVQNHIEEADDGPLWKKLINRRKKDKKQDSAQQSRKDAHDASSDSSVTDGGWRAVDGESDGSVSENNGAGNEDKLYTESSVNIEPAEPIEPAGAIEKAAPIDKVTDLSGSVSEQNDAFVKNGASEEEAARSDTPPEEILEEWKD